MSVSPARRAALTALARVRTREAYAPETLDHVLAEADLSAADTALATRLTYGVLQTQGVLDEVIDERAAHPGSLEPQVRDALRVSAYELLFMRTPEWAAVNEGVAAVRRVRPRAAGMANAILRRVAADSGGFPGGDPRADTATLARSTGHPEWLARVILADLGTDLGVSVLEDANEPAPLYLWANPFAGPPQRAFEALVADGAEPAWCEPAGCLVAGRPACAVRGRAVAEGLAVITDAGAQLAARVANPGAGDVVVELAAGRGTKTLQLQALAVTAGGPADIHTVDLHAFKGEVLTRRLEAHGVPGVTVHTGDAADASSITGLPREVDCVLLDAPCSGLGALRRHPEKRWRLRESDIDALAIVQAALLGQAASLVRPGGVVVYSTCSLARRENHEVVSAFMRGPSGTGFRVRGIRDVVPACWQDWVSAEGYFQSVPVLGGPDGHFVAALERIA